jgi:hypothetical protein
LRRIRRQHGRDVTCRGSGHLLRALRFGSAHAILRGDGGSSTRCIVAFKAAADIYRERAGCGTGQEGRQNQARGGEKFSAVCHFFNCSGHGL